MVAGVTDMPRAAPPDAERRAVIAMAGLPLGGLVAQGLRRSGMRVAVVDVAFDSRADAEAAVSKAAEQIGGADLVIHASAMASALVPCTLAALSAEDWHAAVHRSMLATLYALQAAYRLQRGLLRETGGAVVVLGPSTALVGAAQLVPLMTLAEAQRTLVKSAARQWGRHGMRLNWVGVAARHYASALAGVALPQVPELGPPPPALGRVPEPQADVADLVAWLASDGARALTGASFNLDGGDWMVP